MNKIFLTMSIIGVNFFTTNAQSLSEKNRSVATIAAFTSNGDQAMLRPALADGLDAGLTINEIKEILVQLYAYAGFPRSLNALNTFNSLLKERKVKGISDAEGKLSDPLPTDKSRLVFGTEMQTKLVGSPVRGEVYEFAPAIDQFLKEHLFGDIFGRNNLNWKTRELATISALASMEGTDAQLQSHMGVGMRNGLSAVELEGMVTLLTEKVGKKEGTNAQRILHIVLGKTETNSESTPNMTGKVTVTTMPPADSVSMVGSVRFEPGARTYWHTHPGGQTLVVMEGTGIYQEKGYPAKFIRKGDVVKCPPDVPHWHGATPNAGMTHIAITINTSIGRVNWMQPVTDSEYLSGKE